MKYENGSETARFGLRDTGACYTSYESLKLSSYMMKIKLSDF
jgi:hypothetical protein